MSRHASTSSRRTPRKSAAAAVAVAGLLITGGGVYAGLNAVATNTTAETVNAGTLSLTMADNGTGFSQNISNMAPGDVVNRFVDLTNAGTLAAQNLTLAVADGNSSILSTNATKGLLVTVSSCTSAWVVAGGTATCGDALKPNGTQIFSAPMASMGTQTLASGALTGPYHYEISLTLPDQNETTTNGTPPATTVQGATAALTWTFGETQRAATTTTT